MKTEVENFLKSFHERFPGCTSECMKNGQTENGHSSYEILAGVVDKPGVTLDLACGDGYLLSLVKPGSRRIGVDMSEAELKLAAVWPGLELIHGNGRDIPMPDASVDYLLCHMAFMLMMDVEEIVSEISRVLKPGGIFAAVIPNPAPAVGAEAPQKVYLEVRNRALAEANLKPATWIGDTKTKSEDGIRGLLSRFGSLSFESHTVRYELTLAEAVRYFSLLYTPGQLGEAAFERYKEDLRVSFSALPEPIVVSLPILCWSARK